MNRLFFYGLFMDAALLESMGFHPTVIGPAELTDYQLRIGDRATLVASYGSTSYGIVMKLSASEAAALYAKPGVSDYRPEEVNVVLTNDRSVLRAICYNLPLDELQDNPNTEYAEKLSALVLELGFSAAYANEVASQAEH